MRLPLDWLHEYCRPELETAELARRLTIAGLELERVERHGVGTPEAFVVGRVLEAGPHPDADRLSVCTVDVGAGEPAQIVCGAPNVAAGQTVAVARLGAVMPDGTQLGTAKLRGVESRGMILAEDELGIGPDHDGILVLAENGDGPAPGTPLADVLPIATEVLEFETFHNRPDTLGVYGLARETHAVTGAALAPPPWETDPGAAGEPGGIGIDVQCPDLCPRFTARVFDDVTVAPSPPWLKARLTAMGQRPINNVVDITNYVMLLTAQPLHVFDLDRIAGARLVVRRAADGEQVHTLDGQTRAMDSETVIICDDDGPTSIAGVMGGARSEVEADTRSVLMEVATWDGGNIHRTSTRLGLRSEASARFEKGLSAALPPQAQAVAGGLMLALCGATLRPGTIDAGGPPPDREAIWLRARRVEGVLGVAVPVERCAEALRSVGCETAGAGRGDQFGVLPPEHRLDLVIEEDLIEEIARLVAIGELPATLPRNRPGSRLTPAQRIARAAADALTGRGLHEIAGWSFTSPDMPDRLRLAPDDARRRTVAVKNPMSEQESVMRTTLLASLLGAARHNAARGRPAVALFEQGAVYIDAGDGLPDQPRRLGALLTGPARPPSWREPDPPRADVFAAKGVLAGVLDTLRIAWTVEVGAQPFLHPGRAASVLIAGEPAGWLGELHPVVAGDWDLDCAAAFEVDLDAIVAAAPGLAAYEEETSFPAVRQDIAVVVAGDVAAARVLDVVRVAGGPLLAHAGVFDVYRGAQVGEGMVSLAIALEFRAGDRTLTDADAAAARAAIAAALQDELGGELRA